MFSGSNLPRVGTYNINVVLGSVQAADGISRVEIAKQTGLTAQTVSVIVRRLIEQGIVLESGSLPSTGGKPRTTLRINPTAAYAIGIHFDPIEVSVVVVDMKGQSLVHSRHAISPRLEPEGLIAHAAEVARKHLAELEIPDERVLGAVSYTHLDVYKRQPHLVPSPPGSVDLSRATCIVSPLGTSAGSAPGTV